MLKIERLPLLTFLEEKYRLEETLPLRGYICVFIQHLLASNLSLIRSLERAGIGRGDLYIFGKAYSSAPQVVEYLRRNGYRCYNPTEGYHLDSSYDTLLEHKIREVLGSVLPATDQPVLVLDDAAKAICILHEPEFTEHLPRVRSVELTTRGLRELKKIPLRCPVVDIASSHVKKTVEAPLIGDSMADELSRFLNRWSGYYRPPSGDILLIGYGTIGKTVCRRLRDRFDVTVYDHEPEPLAQAARDGHRITENPAGERFGIVVGCTGSSDLMLDDLSHNPGALFVNMSSSDLEFGLWKFGGTKKRAAATLGYPGAELPFHEFYGVENGDRKFFIANSGFPIDFTGENDPIPAEKIQITRALVLAAAWQAIRETHNGIIELDREVQSELENIFTS